MYYSVYLRCLPNDIRLASFSTLYLARRFASDLLVPCYILNPSGNEVSITAKSRVS